MEFLSLEAADYETALRQARTTYGPLVRVHTRKDFRKKTLFTSTKRCLITFYLVNREEHPGEVAQAEIPLEAAPFDAFSCAHQILLANGLGPELSGRLAHEVEGENEGEVELALLETLLSPLQFEQPDCLGDHRFIVFLGEGDGDDSIALMNIGFFIHTRQAKRVALLSLGGAPLPVCEDLDCYEAEDTQTLRTLLPTLAQYDHVLVSRRGSGWEEALGGGQCQYGLFVKAGSSSEQSHLLLRKHEAFPLSVLVATKLDQADQIGGLLELMHDSKLPLLFCTKDGVEREELVSASVTMLLPFLKGFALDFDQLYGKSY